MKLTVIGASGSFPGPGSPASCYLVTADGPDGVGGTRPWRVLLDLGNGSLGVLQRYIDLEQLDGVLLSHLHPDHCMDLCGLHVAVRWNPAGWHAGRIPVYGPAATATRLRTKRRQISAHCPATAKREGSSPGRRGLMLGPVSSRPSMKAPSTIFAQ